MTSENAELSAKYAEAQRNAQRAMALFKETQEENDELRVGPLHRIALLTRPARMC